MNQRERFLNTMRFKPVDRIPFWHPWVYTETMERWKKKELPGNINLEELFCCDKVLDVNISNGICPHFEEATITEDDKSRTYIDFQGVTVRQLKNKEDSSMLQFINYPVKCRDDFEQMKNKLCLNEKARFHEDWDAKCRLWKERKCPLRMWGDTYSRREAGFFGPLRGMMGLEAVIYTFYDDPAFIEEMMDNRVELLLAILEKTFRDTTIDFFMFWEDMACNNGPLLSPEMFKKYMVPRYRKITDFLRGKGVDIIIVDSDGDISKLIPLWLEAGVNGMLPFEAGAGMDVVKLRKEYGTDLLMIGGFEKKVLLEGKRDIEEELKRIEPILSKGGYIPFPDHIIPLETPFENYLYYMTRLEDMINNG